MKRKKKKSGKNKDGVSRRTAQKRTKNRKIKIYKTFAAEQNALKYIIIYYFMRERNDGVVKYVGVCVRGENVV